MIPDTSGMDRAVARAPRTWPRLLGAVVVALAAGAILVSPSVGRWAATEHSEDRDRLRFADAIRGDLVFDVAVQGRIVAASRPTLFSPAAGLVSLRVREGERVTGGQTLAEIESPELDNRLAQERAALARLRTELGRARRALGGERWAIVRYFLVENSIIAVTGIAVGLIGAFALNVALVTGMDGAKLSPGLALGGVVLLWAVGVLATVLPARRASLIAPALATRSA